MKLNLGCGFDYKNGYINIDGNPNLPMVDVLMDITPKRLWTAFHNEKIDEIYCNGIIEHFTRHNAIALFKCFYKLLANGGRLWIQTHNVESIMKLDINIGEKIKWLYGGQDKQTIFPPNVSRGYEHYHCHKYGWTPQTLTGVLRRINFKDIECVNKNRSFSIECFKSSIEITPPNRIKLMVGPVGRWEYMVTFQLLFLTSVGLKPEHKLLDFGCGVLRGGLPIINYLNRGNYYGYDISDKRLDEGKRRIKESGLEYKKAVLKNHCGFGTKFDYVWCSQVFMHLDDAMLLGAVRAIKQCLTLRGICYATIFIGDENKHIANWAEFPVIKRTAHCYKTLFERFKMDTEIVYWPQLSKKPWKILKAAHRE